MHDAVFKTQTVSLSDCSVTSAMKLWWLSCGSLSGCFPRPLTDTLNYSQGGNWIRPVPCQTGPEHPGGFCCGILLNGPV